MAAPADGFKEQPDDIARAILDGIANGEEDIYADDRARQAFRALCDDPRKVEAESEARWRRDWMKR
jgi:hypothetical protein